MNTNVRLGLIESWSDSFLIVNENLFVFSILCEPQTNKTQTPLSVEFLHTDPNIMWKDVRHSGSTRKQYVNLRPQIFFSPLSLALSVIV